LNYNFMTILRHNQLNSCIINAVFHTIEELNCVLHITYIDEKLESDIIPF
jgi:hypothetical protein